MLDCFSNFFFLYACKKLVVCHTKNSLFKNKNLFFVEIKLIGRFIRNRLFEIIIDNVQLIS